MRKLLLLSIISIFIPSLTYAHQLDGGGLIAGLTHPILGFDH